MILIPPPSYSHWFLVGVLAVSSRRFRRQPHRRTLTCARYGQTGSGKTYTMEGLEQRIAQDLFAVGTAVARRSYASEHGLPADSEHVTKITADDAFVFEITFLEILGKSTVDLVEVPSEFDAQGNPLRKQVVINEDKVCNHDPCSAALMCPRSGTSFRGSSRRRSRARTSSRRSSPTASRTDA